MKPNYQKAVFLLSVAQMPQLPEDKGMEVAIIGASNVGKSSILNRLTQNKSLARVSKTPGRTQLINLFGLDDDRRIADLPGYGYAKVPVAIKKQWQQLLDNYLQNRQCLKGLILVMDSRHPLKDFDKQLLEWSQLSELPVHIILNKIDKLNTSSTKKTLFEVSHFLKSYSNPITLQIFSALKNIGIKELRETLDKWFN